MLQETSVLSVHIAGAVSAFGLASVYAWIQTVVSYRVTPRLVPRGLCHFRAFTALIVSLSFITSILCGLKTIIMQNKRDTNILITIFFLKLETEYTVIIYNYVYL